MAMVSRPPPPAVSVSSASSAGERYDTAQVLCYVFVIVVLVIALDCVLRAVEKRVLRWQ